MADQQSWEGEMYRLLVENVKDYAIFVMDATGIVQSWNPGAERLLGYREDEIVGRSADCLFTPEDVARGEPDKERLQALKTGRGRDDRWHVRQDGIRFWSSGVMTPLWQQDGTLRGFAKIMRDRTEAKLAAEALQKSAHELRLVTDHVPVLIAHCDAQQRFRFVNRGYAERFEMQPEEAIGKHIEEIVGADGYASLQPYVERALAGETVEYEVEMAYPRLGRRLMHCVYTPERASDGAVQGWVAVSTDVTARREVESRLQASEHLFRILTSHAPVGIFQADAEGNCLFVSERWCKLAGLSPAEARGRGWVRALHPDDRERVLKQWHATAQIGRDFASEYRFRTAAGTVSWLQGRAVPLRDEAGAVIGHIGTITDITERKRLEEELRQRVSEVSEAEGRIRSVVNNVVDGIITINARGTIESLNPAAERIFGYSADEVVGQNVKVLMPEPYRGEHDGYLENYLRTGQAKIIGIGREVVGRRKDGSTFPMDLAVGEFRLGPRRYFTGVVRDIGERKRMENALRFLADASATLARIVDYHSTLQQVAGLAVPRFADWCAVDIIEADGSLQRLAVVHTDPAKVKLAHALHERYPSDPQAPRGLPQVLRSGKPDMMTDIPDALLEQSARDAEHLRILRELGLKSYMCVPLQGRGRLYGVISFVSAESQRRYTEADLAFAEELARRAAIAIENALLYAELREADRLKDEFLAMLAHELRNPLAPIRNALHIMKHEGAPPAALVKARDMAQRQVQHMARLLDDLLDVSRISRGVIDLHVETVDVADIVRRTVEALRSLVDERGHRLTVEVPAEPLRLRGDPTRLEQILTNLLNNAVKYTDPGGQIRVSAAGAAGEVVVRVHDNGIGIAPDMLPRIFDLFVQAERRLDRAQGGVGIGLTLVRRLVELHGGSIEAHSPGVGKGSEFVVRLPAAVDTGAEATGPVARPGEGRETRRRRILVVDDNQDAADSLALLLRLSGHDVRAAYDGPSALDEAHAFRPDLVLLDIGMPGMDGYEVARRLRADTSRPDIVLVAVTGWGQEQDRKRSSDAGFDHHLVKPVEPRALERLLRQAGPSRARSEAE